MAFWLVKSEPSAYSWDQFVSDGKTCWDGVRNYAARNFLREMKKGEQVLFYHSNEGQAVVGIAEVIRESYQDPTTVDNAWLAVDVKPLKQLKKPVPLPVIRLDPVLSGIALIKNSRLSVMPVSKKEFEHFVKLGS